MNIACSKELYNRLNCEDILNWIRKLSTIKDRIYIDYATQALILMIDNAQIQSYVHMVEEIIEYLVKEIIKKSKIGDELLDRAFIIIEKFVQKPNLIFV